MTWLVIVTPSRRIYVNTGQIVNVQSLEDRVQLIDASGIKWELGTCEGCGFKISQTKLNNIKQWLVTNLTGVEVNV